MICTSGFAWYESDNIGCERGEGQITSRLQQSPCAGGPQNVFG